MSELIVRVRAPSNIALMKYMGKSDSNLNLPENPSLSLTLNNLCTVAELRLRTNAAEPKIIWLPELPDVRDVSLSSGQAFQVPKLSEKGIQKVIAHVERVVRRMPELLAQFELKVTPAVKKPYEIYLRTANSFPEASGIASSASSFAAITLATAVSFAEDRAQFEKVYEMNKNFRRCLAQMSRQGSGSSCRSFEGPFVLWEGEATFQLTPTQLPPLAHFVVLFETEPKKVSSSEAHLLVRSSPLWEGRVKRVKSRTERMCMALSSGDFSSVAQLSWSEAWEMHSLFHTAERPFSYWRGKTMEALQWLAPRMGQEDSPIVTLDAGPNIHIMVPQSKRDEWLTQLKKQFPNDKILEDAQGTGAKIISTKEG